MQFRRLRSPTNVQWELTPCCNYKCFHCYNYWRTGGEVSGHIDYGLVVSQLIENNVFNLVLTGGEPLLMYDEIKPHIEKLVEAGIKVSINTNAALLNQEMAEFFKANNVGLLISLPCYVPEINDKITNAKNSFDLTVAGMKLARRNGVNFTVNMVVSKLNKDYVVDTAKFLYENLGIKSFNATKASRPINGCSEFDDYALNLEELRKMYSDLLLIKEKYGMFVDSLTVYPECSCDSSEKYSMFTVRKCYAGKTGLAIGYNGDVKACARDSFSYGNLSEKTLKECWDSMDDLRKDDCSSLPKECQNCNVKEFCSGGCRLDMENEIPNKCYRDSGMLPISFEPKINQVFDYLETDIFKVEKGLKFFEEDFGMRGINQRKNVFFVSNILHSFLTNNTSFSKEKFIKEFEISSDDANEVLSYLVSNKVVNNI